VEVDEADEVGAAIAATLTIAKDDGSSIFAVAEEQILVDITAVWANSGDENELEISDLEEFVEDEFPEWVKGNVSNGDDALPFDAHRSRLYAKGEKLMLAYVISGD